MRNWLKKLWSLIPSGLLGVFIGIFLSYTINLFWKEQQIANAYMATFTMVLAIATGFLAYFTYRSVKSGYDREKRDRKEHLLNEIIEWAKNISKCGIKEDIDFWTHDDRPENHITDEVASDYLETYLQKPKHEPKYECLYWLQLLSIFLVLKEECVYINTVSSKIFPNLLTTTNNIENELDHQIVLLRKGVTGSKEITTTKINLQREKLLELARKLIKEATKIKTKDVG